MKLQAQSVQTMKAQHTSTVILQVGDSLVRLTAHQARRLASVLVAQADAVTLTGTESADAFLVDGWIAKSSQLRRSHTRMLLIACRPSKVVLREANPV
ncbi:hypothetical protein [Nitrospira sp. Nam74]